MLSYFKRFALYSFRISVSLTLRKVKTSEQLTEMKLKLWFSYFGEEVCSFGLWLNEFALIFQQVTLFIWFVVERVCFDLSTGDLTKFNMFPKGESLHCLKVGYTYESFVYYCFTSF